MVRQVPGGNGSKPRSGGRKRCGVESPTAAESSWSPTPASGWLRPRRARHRPAGRDQGGRPQRAAADRLDGRRIRRPLRRPRLEHGPRHRRRSAARRCACRTTEVVEFIGGSAYVDGIADGSLSELDAQRQSGDPVVAPGLGVALDPERVAHYAPGGGGAVSKGVRTRVDSRGENFDAAAEQYAFRRRGNSVLPACRLPAYALVSPPRSTRSSRRLAASGGRGRRRWGRRRFRRRRTPGRIRPSRRAPASRARSAAIPIPTAR